MRSWLHREVTALPQTHWLHLGRGSGLGEGEMGGVEKGENSSGEGRGGWWGEGKGRKGKGREGEEGGSMHMYMQTSVFPLQILHGQSNYRNKYASFSATIRDIWTKFGKTAQESGNNRGGMCRIHLLWKFKMAATAILNIEKWLDKNISTKFWWQNA